jgi:nicotinamidase-related amidase
MSNYLIVIDMQNDFIDGSLGSKDAVSVLPKVIEKVWEFDGKVLFTYDTHGEDYENTYEGRNLPVRHCIEGTDGWKLNAELEKARYSSGGKAFTKRTFASRELALYLESENQKETIGKIEIVGLCTDICVVANAMLIKAFLPETEIAVDASCCAGTTPEKHLSALEVMRSCQIIV